MVFFCDCCGRIYSIQQQSDKCCSSIKYNSSVVRNPLIKPKPISRMYGIFINLVGFVIILFIYAIAIDLISMFKKN